jgi:hypothetical protein
MAVERICLTGICISKRGTLVPSDAEQITRCWHTKLTSSFLKSHLQVGPSAMQPLLRQKMQDICIVSVAANIQALQVTDCEASAVSCKRLEALVVLMLSNVSGKQHSPVKVLVTYMCKHYRSCIISFFGPCTWHLPVVLLHQNCTISSL